MGTNAAMPDDKIELRKVKEIQRKDILLSLIRISGSSRLIVGSSDSKIYGFDPASGSNDPYSEWTGHESYVSAIAPTSYGFVSGGFDRKMIWWDEQSKHPIRSYDDAHGKFLRDVVTTPNGKRVISVADDMVAKIWDVSTTECVAELKGHEIRTPHHYPSMLYACAVSPDSRYLATADRVGKILLWDLEEAQQVTTLDVQEMYTWDPKQRRHSIGGVRSVAFSNDGESLAVGGMGKVGNIDHLDGKARIEIFRWRSGERTHLYGDGEFKGLVESLQFHPTFNWLVASGGDQSGFIQIFDLADPKKSLRDEKAPMHVHQIAIDEQGENIYGVGHNRIVHWHCNQGTGV